jgi:hypothetical protein
MHRRGCFVLMIAMSLALPGVHAMALEPLREHCSVRTSEKPGHLRLRISDEECEEDRHCGSSYSNDLMNRLTGISAGDFSREGAQLTAKLEAEAGNFSCSGTVHDGVLAGASLFEPDEAFVKRMAQMGVEGLDSKKLQAYAFVNVESGWALSLKQTGIQGIDADKLIALRIFNVTPEYIRSITELGYALPTADQLIAMRVQGVDAKEVREVRALGFRPDFDELVQMRIFHITPEFIRRMQARDFKDLTIAKLVQIRIFKLDE